MYSTTSNQKMSTAPLKLNITSKKATTGTILPVRPSGVTSSRGVVGTRQQQKPMRPAVPPLQAVKHALSSKQPQQKLIQNMPVVQPAIPQQLEVPIIKYQQSGAIFPLKKDLLRVSANQKVPYQNQFMVPLRGILTNSKDSQVSPVRQQTLLPDLPLNQPNFTCILHPLPTFGKRRKATKSVNKPSTQTSDSKDIGNLPVSSIGDQNVPVVSILKTPKAQLSQSKSDGKVKKLTLSNIQQRQFMEQTRKYIIAHPEHLKMMKKSITTPKRVPTVHQEPPPGTIINIRSPQNRRNTVITVKTHKDLYCPICTELFLHARSLPCSHVFCQYCLTQWQIKCDTCPVCKVKIFRHYPAKAIDNFIAKYLKIASKEVNDRRHRVISQRLAETMEEKRKKFEKLLQQNGSSFSLD